MGVSWTATMVSEDGSVRTQGVPNVPFRYVVDRDKQYQHQTEQFRNHISPDGDAPFPAEKGRYALYVHPACPWAHRTLLALSLKGLQDFIQVIVLDAMDPLKGWYFSGKLAGPEQDPLYGAKYLRQIYERADPSYSARVTIPMLWDKTKETIVSTDSSDITLMFYTAFDDLLPERLRENSKAPFGFYPLHLRSKIDKFNEWVFNIISNGVYRVGFATDQAEYERHIQCLFAALDKLEAHFEETKMPYLLGHHITDADVRLFPTIIRFDAVYFTLFKCNLKMIRYDYPRLHGWMKRLYWDESGWFKKTTHFDIIKKCYAMTMKSAVIPAGPIPHVLPPDSPPKRVAASVVKREPV